MVNRENNGQNLIELIADIISKDKGVKDFLNCIKHPEHRRIYLQEKISNLFGEDRPSRNFLVRTLYEIQGKTGVDMDIAEIDGQFYLRKNLKYANQECEII